MAQVKLTHTHINMYIYPVHAILARFVRRVSQILAMRHGYLYIHEW